ncbi:DUF1033 family protein [Streptococcus equinus]|uniref:DUF1033 family protein n=1 Tax=Streptococcus equinus TaxID=1335 RepID=UPI0015F3C899|nr:DUF1033 family protein [Streptococcus equinus]QMS96434.1 DUF1033 family protein [Streptococcus equinus]
MYQVIKMYGDWEPWWFLDDWQDDIIEEQSFEYFEEALSFYCQEWELLRTNLPSCKCHDNFQAAFWDKAEKRWCENCGDYLQQYHSLLILKDGQELAKEQFAYHFNIRNDEPSSRPQKCKFKL